MRIVKYAGIVMSIVTAGFFAGALADPIIADLAVRLELIQQEMDQLRQQITRPRCGEIQGSRAVSAHKRASH
jgi:hypothetical protein